MRRLEGLLRPFFDKYDNDSNGQLDIQEFWAVFHDLKEHVQTTVSAIIVASEGKAEPAFLFASIFVVGFRLSCSRDNRAEFSLEQITGEAGRGFLFILPLHASAAAQGCSS